MVADDGQNKVSAWPWRLACAAALCAAAAAAGFGWAHPGFDHWTHPLAWLGAQETQYAAGFNGLFYVLPGLLLALVALGLRNRLGAWRWPARVGAQLLLVSAMAFAAQGLLRLQPDDLDGPLSQWHAFAWTVWWLAFAAAGALLAAGLRGARNWRGLGVGASLAAMAVAVATLALPGLIGAALAQRVAVAVWFGWWLWLGARLNRDAASSPEW